VENTFQKKKKDDKKNNGGREEKRGGGNFKNQSQGEKKKNERTGQGTKKKTLKNGMSKKSLAIKNWKGEEQEKGLQGWESGQKRNAKKVCGCGEAETGFRFGCVRVRRTYGGKRTGGKRTLPVTDEEANLTRNRKAAAPNG